MVSQTYKNLDKKGLEKLSKEELIKMLEHMNSIVLDKQIQERDKTIKEKEEELKN